MPIVEVKDDKAYCQQCGKEVSVKDRPGEQSTPQKPRVLIDQRGHIIAERDNERSQWETAV